MAKNVYGLDLGTYDIKIYDHKKDQIWKAKNVIAMEKGGHVYAAGDRAYEMYQKAPGNIKVVFPMQNGVISHFDYMQYLLQALLKTDRQFSRGAAYVVAVPTDVTEVEKRAFYDLVQHSAAKAGSVKIVERGIADAVGLSIDIQREKGVLIANIGGETTELSVLASGGMVLNRLIKIGGIHFDTAIMNLVRHNQDFLIGRLTAETLRRNFGVFEQGGEAQLTVAGRNLLTGVPGQRTIPIGLVRAAMKEPLGECVKAVKSMIDRTPPDVRKGIDKNGIFLTGGMTNLKGLATYLEEGTGQKATCAPEPELCAVRGLKEIIQNKEYKKLTYSMLDEDYRWLR